MITRQQIIDRVRFLIAERDPDNSFVYDPDIITITNNILPEFVRETHIPRNNITITTSNGVVEYALENTILDVLSVTYKQRLEYKDYNTYLQNKDTDTTFASEPEEYYLREGLDDSISDHVLILGLDPTPDDEYELILNCVVLPNSFSGEEVISIPFPSTALTALCYRICQDLMVGDNKPEMAGFYQTLYEDAKTKLKTFLNNRNISYVNEGREQ